MVRSRGASRKPLCIFPEDLPMGMFHAHGAFLRGTGAPVCKGIDYTSLGQPKCTAQQELYSQPPPRDAWPCMEWPGHGRAHRLGLSWSYCCFSHLRAQSWSHPWRAAARASGPRTTFLGMWQAPSVHLPHEPIFQCVAKLSFWQERAVSHSQVNSFLSIAPLLVVGKPITISTSPPTFQGIVHFIGRKTRSLQNIVKTIWTSGLY